MKKILALMFIAMLAPSLVSAYDGSYDYNNGKDIYFVNQVWNESDGRWYDLELEETTPTSFQFKVKTMTLSHRQHYTDTLSECQQQSCTYYSNNQLHVNGTRVWDNVTGNNRDAMAVVMKWSWSKFSFVSIEY
jgi:hypothetical protein